MKVLPMKMIPLDYFREAVNLHRNHGCDELYSGYANISIVLECARDLVNAPNDAEKLKKLEEAVRDNDEWAKEMGLRRWGTEPSDGGKTLDGSA